MPPATGRRDVLRALIAGTAGAAVASLVPAPVAHAQGAAHTLQSTRLTDRLLLISGAGGNVVLALGPDAAVMVNGGQREHAQALLQEVAVQSSGARISHLFNTDWHAEHTGANQRLASGGTQIVAHENTKQYLGAEMFVEWQHRSYPPLPPAARPSATFYTSGTLSLGPERVEYGQLGQAHTDGDIYVFFREANVLAVGDVLAVNEYPIADYTSGGWLGGMVTATRTLVDLANDQTRIVPGRGPVQTRADLKTQHDMLVTLRDRLAKMMRQGLGAEDMLAAGVTREFDDRCGNPALFVSTSYRGLWLHVRELGGIV